MGAPCRPAPPERQWAVGTRSHPASEVLPQCISRRPLHRVTAALGRAQAAAVEAARLAARDSVA